MLLLLLPPPFRRIPLLHNPIRPRTRPSRRRFRPSPSHTPTAAAASYYFLVVPSPLLTNLHIKASSPLSHSRLFCIIHQFSEESFSPEGGEEYKYIQHCLRNRLKYSTSIFTSNFCHENTSGEKLMLSFSSSAQHQHTLCLSSAFSLFSSWLYAQQHDIFLSTTTPTKRKLSYQH